MFNEENTARFQRLQVAHEAERQQRQIQLLDAELARVRMTRAALAVIAALVAVSLALLYARYRLKKQSEARLQAQATELSEALEGVKTLRGLLPICAWCHKIRDDQGYWTRVEAYVTRHSEAAFTHSICPSCASRHLEADDQPAPASRPA
jgi:ABC-type nickel/cobalt efflux system permease component RcnA